MTNADGFRDVEHQPVKPEGVVRIMVLGDSITAGLGIPDAEAVYTRLLESQWNARNTRCEVFNLGVGGYHTLQEVEAFRLKGLAYDPDLVLVAFCINDFDFTSDGGVWESLTASNADLDIGHWRSGMRSWLAPLLRGSRLAFFVHHRLESHLPRAESKADYIENVLDWRTPVEAGLDLLAELRVEHGFDARVVLIPTFDQPSASYQYGPLYDAVTELASVRGMEVLDLREDFRALGEDARVFGTDGIHPNARGHQALADILARRLHLP